MEQAVAFASARGLDVRTVGEGGSYLKLIARVPTQLGQTLTIAFAGAERKVNLPLIGAYQVANALVAAGLALATGMAPSAVFDALTRLQPVRGRLERAAITQQGAPVYVDYAHTPDALEAAMAALRPHVGAGGRLIAVFGAGGDRDTGKRALMGEVAARAADLVIVTDDNPRSEDPAAIRAAIMAGAGQSAREVPDRRAAIAAAITAAGEHDIVLIAGKGHEQGQIFGSGDSMRIEPFDDVEVARECAGAGSAGR
jgi:UDP-N-acetylmuramoyl-L-alanyl-D-glutamate--2,6-diaminopimelate ligase